MLVDRYKKQLEIVKWNKPLEKTFKKLLWKALIVEKYIDDEIKKVKSVVEKAQKEGKKVLIICMTWDLMLPWHINYVKAWIEKVKKKFNLKDDELFVIVWLEREKRTLKRKWKLSILRDEEKKYQRRANKYVDYVFTRDIDINLYPSDLMLYIEPDYRISHQEYFDFWRYLRVAKKLIRWTNSKTKPIVVTFEDQRKLPEWNVRERRNISTSNVVKRALTRQKEWIAKKYWKEIIDILMEIDFKSLNNENGKKNNW